MDQQNLVVELEIQSQRADYEEKHSLHNVVEFPTFNSGQHENDPNSTLFNNQRKMSPYNQFLFIN